MGTNDLKKQVFLGSDDFIEQMQEKMDELSDLSEIPIAQRRPISKPLIEYEQLSTNRNETIYKAYSSGGYTLKEVGEHFGLHYSTVSGIIKYHKS